MSKVSLSKDDFEKKLQEQIALLKNASSNYDNGCKEEVINLATRIRVLVHDTASSTSVLTHLGKKDILFADTATPVSSRMEDMVTSYTGLTQVIMKTNDVEIAPHFDELPNYRKITFEDWWNGVVVVDKNKNSFSRKNIVLIITDSDGGAHVDKTIDQKYLSLRKNNALGWTVMSKGRELPGEDQVPATMRQIAHEMLKTLIPDYTFRRKNDDTEIMKIAGFSLYYK